MTIITLPNGKLRGSLDEDGVYSFMGVPYAEPIAGRARWLPPQPRGAWSDVRDARSYRTTCQQFGGSGSSSKWVLPFPRARRRFLSVIQKASLFQEGDDCLVLNIWSPSIDRNAKLPVMMYIHGGGLSTGAAHGYDGSRLARLGVVAIAIQYRLGPVGFLNGSGLFDGELCADNRGCLDQLLALRWIQENIACFGGDPGCVTIFGESAGAQSVYMLAASPQAKGLFQRAIGMGGNTFAWAPADEYHRLARDALQDVGVAAGDAQALIALDAGQRLKLNRALTAKALAKDEPPRYGSISRTQLNHVGATTGTDFLPHPPLESYARGTPNDIDLMLGTCQDEGTVFSVIIPPFRSVSARLCANGLRGFMPRCDLEEIFKHYRLHMRGATWGRIYEQINTDTYFRASTVQAAEAHASSHPGRTFLYQVNCQGSIPGLRATHGVDIALVLGGGPLRFFLDDDPATLHLSEVMRMAWVNFAKTGKPAAPGLPRWQPYDATRRATMVLDHVSRLDYDVDGPLLQYWRSESVPPSVMNMLQVSRGLG